MKQDIHEMIPVLTKVIPLRSISLKFTVAYIKDTQMLHPIAQTWQIVEEDVPK